MAVRQREWVQREWTQPGVDLYRERGDFYDLQQLLLTAKRRALERAPAWSAHVVFPAGFTACRGAYYEENNGRIAFLGTNAAAHLAVCYADTAWVMSAITELTDLTTNLGGLFGRNVVWRGGRLYTIGADSKVYGPSVAAHNQLYAVADAVAIVPLGDRIFIVTVSGEILRLNDADTGFVSHFNPVCALEIVYATAYRQYLLVVAYDGNGGLRAYYVSPISPQTLQHVAYLSIAGSHTTYPELFRRSNSFTIHSDVLYFTSFNYAAVGTQVIDVYSFNGSQFAHLTQIPDTLATARGTLSGLTPWQGELVLFELQTGAGKEQTFRILSGDGFTTLTTTTVDAATYAFSLSDELILVAESGAVEGFYHASRLTLDDGYLITSRLDMDRPGRQKRLLRVTVLLDGAAADFNVIIKYRCDDTTAWTTAVTSDDTRRATVDITTAVTFYTIQLRVDLDDDTGNDEDIRIGAVSVVYSVPD